MSQPDYSPTHPNRRPQGGVHAYLIDHGRVYVQSITTDTALVRADCGDRMRSRVKTVPLAQIDFTREWKFR